MNAYIDATEAPLKNTGVIRLYDEKDFAGMRVASQITAKCLDELAEVIKPGVTTQEVDDFVVEFGRQHHAIPATLNSARLRRTMMLSDCPTYIPASEAPRTTLSSISTFFDSTG